MSETTKRVLVTGGAGYVGSHIIYQLLDKGYTVRTTVHNTDDPKLNFLETFHPKGSEVEVVHGDLLQADGWSEIVQGFRTAVEGTEHCLKAVAQHKEHIRKVVLTSSVASIISGHSKTRRNEGPFTEADWSVEEDTHGYELSKLRAERAGWAIQKEAGFHMDAICPGLIVGPILAKHHRDCQSSQYLETFLRNRLMLSVDVTMPLTDVRDVAALHIAAMEQEDHTGNRYISASDAHCASSVAHIGTSLIAGVAQECNYNPPAYRLPNTLAWALSFVHPELKPSRSLIGANIVVSNEKAKKDLGFNFRDVDVAISEHAVSLFKYGELDPKGYPADKIEAHRAY